jgi:hypothetical protein
MVPSFVSHRMVLLRHCAAGVCVPARRWVTERKLHSAAGLDRYETPGIVSASSRLKQARLEQLESPYLSLSLTYGSPPFLL